MTISQEAQLNQDLRACADKVRCLEIELLETKRSYKAKLQVEQHPVVEEGTALQDQVKTENTPKQQEQIPQRSEQSVRSKTTNKTFCVLRFGSVSDTIGRRQTTQEQ
ncbi:hypothetical protein AAFF_G00101280 [Aldrovandia affinis]|uniref:Uncharacterized protein n=1 Tax=Aldrovandia affinis TaxID=143900 RepID=A0AAD7WBN6_9TELE|nr:hypothetical protein AAFF_G00101280 [Aldrovandia affinis]